MGRLNSRFENYEADAQASGSISTRAKSPTKACTLRPFTASMLRELKWDTDANFTVRQASKGWDQTGNMQLADVLREMTQQISLRRLFSAVITI